MVAKYISKLNNAQLDVYYSQHSAAIPLPHSGIKNKNYKVISENPEANKVEPVSYTHLTLPTSDLV